MKCCTNKNNVIWHRQCGDGGSSDGGPFCYRLFTFIFCSQPYVYMFNTKRHFSSNKMLPKIGPLNFYFSTAREMRVNSENDDRFCEASLCLEECRTV